MQKLAYTLGEPAGIGPDIIIQMAQTEALNDLLVIGDADLLQDRARRLGLPLRVHDNESQQTDIGELKVRHQALADTNVCGSPSAANVPAVLSALDTAIDGCVDGVFSAMITGPLHKGVINDAGVAFSGHTEYLAQRTNAELPVMLLATHAMRVALVTTHLPLKDVSAAISQERIEQVCRIIDHDLRHRYKIKQPRLLVCGLNPHAGEGGHLGSEEIDTIIPALDNLRAQGLTIEGPLPADTLFTPKVLARADVAVAMYHDQGLPVLKYHGFGQAANITLGLPIIRTSVDHGTAFDLAGLGTADIGSLRTAIEVARQLAAANT